MFILYIVYCILTSRRPKPDQFSPEIVIQMTTGVFELFINEPRMIQEWIFRSACIWWTKPGDIIEFKMDHILKSFESEFVGLVDSISPNLFQELRSLIIRVGPIYGLVDIFGWYRYINVDKRDIRISATLDNNYIGYSGSEQLPPLLCILIKYPLNTNIWSKYPPNTHRFLKS